MSEFEDTVDAAIALELRDLRPRPASEFVASLDERVNAGFPRRGPIGRIADRFALEGSPRRAIVPSLAFAATACVAIGTAISVIDTPGGDRHPAPLSSGPARDRNAAKPDAATPQSGAAGGGTAAGGESEAVQPQSDVAPLPGPTESIAPGRANRRVRNVVDMVLAPDLGKLESAADEVRRITVRNGGIVLGSELNTSDTGGSASFDLRIPVPRLERSLGQLSDIAHVRSIDRTADDITGPYLQARRSVIALRARARRLRRQAIAASDPIRREQLRAELSAVRSRLPGARREVRRLGHDSDYAQVSLRLVTASASSDDSSWGVSDALRDARDVLGTSAAVAIVALAGGLPLIALLALGIFGIRRRRTAARERVLDAPQSS